VPRHDPYPGFNFLVELGATENTAGFSEVHIGAAHIQLIEYREGADRVNSVRKLPGLTRYDNVVLKRGLTGTTALWAWFDQVRDGDAERRDVRITLLDEQRNAVARWLLRRALPVKYEAPALRATGNEVAIETLELAHERLEFETE
jgi:phage tail-like protein